MANNILDIKIEQKRLEENILIEQSLKGNKDAFAKLYRRYHSQVVAFSARLLRGKYEVEDAVQQVFLEAWRSLPRFEGRSMFATWLTKITIHTCLSCHRKNARFSFGPMAEYPEKELFWGNAQENPDETFFIRERKDIVNKLLNRMTPKKKAVFVMADMKGMSAPEIGKVLNIPDATVRTRLFHARKEFSNWVLRSKSYSEALI